MTSMLLRVLLGRTAIHPLDHHARTMWFAINVLLAPYSAGIRRISSNSASAFVEELIEREVPTLQAA